MCFTTYLQDPIQLDLDVSSQRQERGPLVLPSGRGLDFGHDAAFAEGGDGGDEFRAVVLRAQGLGCGGALAPGVEELVVCAGEIEGAVGGGDGYDCVCGVAPQLVSLVALSSLRREKWKRERRWRTNELFTVLLVREDFHALVDVGPVLVVAHVLQHRQLGGQFAVGGVF